MKNTKLIRSIIALLCAMCLIASFVGCTAAAPEAPAANETPVVSDTETVSAGQMTLVIGSEPPVEYVVDLDEIEGEGLMPVLDYLKENEGLEYTSEESEYGAFLTGVGSLAQDAETSTYIIIYTTAEADADTSEYATTVDYNGTTITSSAVGADSMTIEDGCIVYIAAVSYAEAAADAAA